MRRSVLRAVESAKPLVRAPRTTRGFATANGTSKVDHDHSAPHHNTAPARAQLTTPLGPRRTRPDHNTPEWHPRRDGVLTRPVRGSRRIHRRRVTVRRREPARREPHHGPTSVQVDDVTNKRPDAGSAGESGREYPLRVIAGIADVPVCELQLGCAVYVGVAG